MEMKCENCPEIFSIDRRLIVVETEQKGMKSDIEEIKASQKESKYLLITTLIGVIMSLAVSLYQTMG